MILPKNPTKNNDWLCQTILILYKAAHRVKFLHFFYVNDAMNEACQIWSCLIREWWHKKGHKRSKSLQIDNFLNALSNPNNFKKMLMLIKLYFKIFIIFKIQNILK